MGYLPALDGVRAVAVLAVVGYHLGWGWLSGGFLGVEVFFVVSGYLITSLLLGEHQRNGSVALGPFWLRRARRLLPALGAMVAGVTIWALLFSEATAAVLRRDLVPSLVYVANWWQIFGVEAPYFTPADPPLLRHLWSLAVEEQWYVLWPLVFPWLWTRSGRRRGKVAAVLLAVAVALMAFTAVASWGADANRLNFLYLSTPTRATGLLVGAAAAMVWRPWQGRHHRVPTRVLEVAGWGAVSVLGVAMVTLTVSGMALYRGGLAVVTLASVVLIATVVHPASGRLGRVLGHPWLVAVGRRSYGLYLWHWPIIVFSDARSGGWVAVVTAVVVTVVVTELSYRYVETPVRRGALGAWWTSVRATPLMAQRTRVAVGSAVGVSSVFLVSTVVLGLSRVAVVDPSVDPRDDVVWTAPVAAAPVTTVVNSIPGPAVTSTVAVVVPEQPVRLVVVGDSQAGSLVRNLPEGLDMLFEVSDGSINGCGVYDRGVAVSARQGLRHDFAECADWPVRWADAARQSQAQVALMMIGAWEVLDMEWESTSLPVGAPRTDVHFLREAQRGVNALVEAGAHVAVLEVACMRPLDAPGAGVPALPERGDDRRVAHLNTLLRLLVERNPGTTTFLAGPVEWCSGSPKSVDPAYRWDGVHVYKPGVALIFDTIAGHVLSLAARS